MILSLISGIYATILGIGILGLWFMLLFTRQVPELETEPIAISFHITAESLMGILSLLSGILMLVNLQWSLYLFILTMGLVIYAVINSAGYYGQRKEWGFVIMFAIILIITISLVLLILI